MKYVTGYNMPGYMPDSDCNECEDLESAKAALVWDIEHYLDCMADYEEDEGYEAGHAVLAEFVAAPAMPCNVYIGDLVFWITEA